MSSLGSLSTEARNPRSTKADECSALELCELINTEDATVAKSVKACLSEVARAIDLIAERVAQGGRVLYIGAGTSGRLAVLDASEIPPTYSAPFSQFVAIMAGGDGALRRSVEGGEDSTTQSIDDLSAISPALDPDLDTLIGIAASGRTPYVLSGLEWAQKQGHLTVGIACVQSSEMEGKCEALIECCTGPEVVTGSTRMKAGTATKMILNMISTGVMIRIGKTYSNLMVDMRASNMKLVDRARRIIRTLVPSSPSVDLASDNALDVLLDSCRGSVKLALVVARTGCGVEEAEARLERGRGVLRRAWAIETPQETELGINGGQEEEVSSTPTEGGVEDGPPRLVICIDAGGTKCAAVIASSDGVVARGSSGPCNFKTAGLEKMLENVSLATTAALDALPASLRPSSTSLPPARPIFAAAWLGMAGLDSPSEIELATPHLAALWGLDRSLVQAANDGSLLAAPISTHPDTPSGVALIAGTGSIAASFSTDPATGKLVQVERSGGWGFMLGERGSGFQVGAAAICSTLEAYDRGLPPTPLHLAISAHYGCAEHGDLLGKVYEPVSIAHPSLEPKARIASLCRLVFEAAFDSDNPDLDAQAMIDVAARGSAETIIPLMRHSAMAKESSTLVMGGGLSQSKHYQDMVKRHLKDLGVVFKHLEVVDDVAAGAVGALVSQHLA